MKKNYKYSSLFVLLLFCIVIYTNNSFAKTDYSMIISNATPKEANFSCSAEFKRFNESEKFWVSTEPFKLKVNQTIVIEPTLQQLNTLFFQYTDKSKSGSLSESFIIIESNHKPSSLSFRNNFISLSRYNEKKLLNTDFHINNTSAATKMNVIEKNRKYYILLNCSNDPFAEVKETDEKEDIIDKPYIVPSPNDLKKLTANLTQFKTKFKLSQFMYFDKNDNNIQVDGFKEYIWPTKKKCNYTHAVTSAGGIQSKQYIIVNIKGVSTKDKSIHFSYSHSGGSDPIPFAANMFYYTSTDGQNYTADSYEFSNSEISLTFSEPESPPTPTKIPYLPTETNRQQETKYGIKFAQSDKTIFFEGTIKESEWTYKHIGTNLCAKLKTIYIKENENEDWIKFVGFQDNTYLLSTENQYINQVQGEPIYICLDQHYNPGFLKLRKSLYLDNQNYIHEFKIDDFEFCQDENIKAKKLKKGPLKLNDLTIVPSITLELSNSTGQLKYQKCEICFNEKGNWTISAEAKWTNIGDNTWRAYLSEFTASPENINIDGVVYDSNTDKFQILVPPEANQEKATRIEIYTKSAVDPGNLIFSVTKNVNHLHCTSFHEDNFMFKNKPDKELTKITYNYIDHKFKPRPTVFIETKTKPASFTESEVHEEIISNPDYIFVFNDQNTYTIEKTISNSEWEETIDENDEPCYVTTINNFDVNGRNFSGRIVQGQYQIPIGTSGSPQGKPLKVYMKKDSTVVNKAVSFTFNRNDRSINKGKITAENFKLEDTNFKFVPFAEIETEINTQNPSITLPTIIENAQPDRNIPQKKLNTNAQIMPFSDDMLSDKLKAKLDMNFIQDIEKTCKAILEENAESGVQISLKKAYPDNIEPFSIEVIEIPLPTIDNDFTDDPETILKLLNKEDPAYKVIFFGHIEEDFKTNEIVLCIRAFISKLDDQLAFKETIKISTLTKNKKDINENIKSKIESLILKILNRLPDKSIIETQYQLLQSFQVKSQKPKVTKKPKNSTSDIWNQIDEKNFDVNEYRVRPDIYEINIKNGFYCSVQDFTYDQNKKRRLQESVWKNSYERIPIIKEGEAFISSFYMKITSKHKTNQHKKVFCIIKVLDRPLDLIHANRRIHHFNNIKFADQNNWKIPTIEELTQIFQFKEYHESVSNLIKTFMPPYTNDDRISFWTSTFQNRNKKELWTVRFKCKEESFSNNISRMDYDLEYYPIESTEKAYLLPVSVQK